MTGTRKTKSAGTVTVAPLVGGERRLSGGKNNSVSPDIRNSVLKVPTMIGSYEAEEATMSIPLRVSPRRTSEEGAALLISVFALLLISAIGVAMIAASGTEGSLAANFRSSASAFRPAMSGAEEARGRVSPGSANPFGPAIPAFIPVGTVYYVTNPVGGEAVTPADPNNIYADRDYAAEFLNPPTTVPPPIQSRSPVPGPNPIPGPMYKWVRINAVTEQMLGIKVSGGITPLNNTIALSYDGANLKMGGPGGVQALQVTSLAVLPDGSQKMVQYIVAPAVPLTIETAMFAGTTANMNANMYVNGTTEPACANQPSVQGLKSGSWDNVPDSGRIVGSPNGSKSNAVFPYKMEKLVPLLITDSKFVDAVGAGTGVTKSSGSPPYVYTGSTAKLGTPPTVTVDTSAPPTDPNFHRILSITAEGNPVVYYSPGDLTVGGGTPSTPGAPAVIGHGILVVKGNLTIDVSKGFLYYGLIVATGDITFKGDSTAAGMFPEIHGAVISGGAIDASLVKGSRDHVAVIQNACMFMNSFNNTRVILSFREIPQ